jgi:hypothetical protein
MSFNSSSIVGTLTICPWLKTSKSGTDWCEFTVLDKASKPITCMAFKNVAISICNDAKIDDKLILQGSMKDGKFMVNGFSFSNKETTSTIAKLKAVDAEKTPVDMLMDLLTPAYVSERIRDVLFTDQARTLFNFDNTRFKALLSELWDEAAQKDMDGQARESF